jgi:soluble lytic murein transglycosylase-like protein
MIRCLAAAALALCVASPAHALDLRALVSDVAHQFGVPAALANGIAHVETGHRCGAIGSLGERGPLQLRPSTARGMGYRGPVQGLSDCRTGTTWAMLYLRQAYVAAHGNWAVAATKYNAGVGTRRRSSAYARKVLAAAR